MDYPAIEDWVAERGLEIQSFLGQGTSGAAWLLSNGQVLKVTTDERELECIEVLDSINATSPHLPIIYAYGELPSGDFFILREYLAPLPKSLLDALPLSPNPLLDRNYIREETPELLDFYEQYETAIAEFESYDGVMWRDLDWIHNWGIREDGTLVLFDASCYKYRNRV